MKRIYSIPSSSSAIGNEPNSFCWQKKKSKYLAVANDNAVNIYNRHGEHVDQINLFGICSALSWDEQGDWLAIITNRSPLIFLWNSTTKKLEQIDTGMKETLCVITWARSPSSSSVLFLGTIKGNLLFYNNQTSRKNPIYGKHSKRIISAAWNETNLIAVVAEDRILTVNNEDGETLCYNSLKGHGSMVKFFHSYQEDQQISSGNIPGLPAKASSPIKRWKGRAKNRESNSVCLVLNKRMLFMMPINDSENSFILNFKDWYENIVDFYCYQNGNIFVAFTSGLIITISTGQKNFGVELEQIKVHRDSMSTFGVCTAIERIASAAENYVKIFDLHDHNDVEHVFTVDDEPAIVSVDWTQDGQLLALGSSSGNIHIYLSQLKIIGDNYGTSLAYLSSLLEVTIFNVRDDIGPDSVMIIRVETEPSRLAIGPFHLAVSMNNKIWMYSITGNELLNPLLNECEYSGIVKDMKLNQNFMAILFTNGTIQFHPIEQSIQANSNQNDTMFTYFTYPDSGETTGGGNGTGKKSALVTAMSLTPEFLIFSLDNGAVMYFVIEDWSLTTVYRHTNSIQMMQSNHNGTRLVLVDIRNEAYVFNVHNETAVQIVSEAVPSKPVKILWESWTVDRSVFTICDQKFIYVYASPVDTIEGPLVEYVDKMKIPGGQYPLLLYNGVMVCQTKSGKTANFVLATHNYAVKNTGSGNDSGNVKPEVLRTIVKLRRYEDALRVCNLLEKEKIDDINEWWRFVARAAIKDLSIDIAIRIYRHLGQYNDVYCLERYHREQEEQAIYNGLLAEMIGEFDLAQGHFLQSTRPVLALEMRRNLQHWTEALALARRLSPTDVPDVSVQLARYQEHCQEYQKALENFEYSLEELKKFSDDSNNNNNNNVKQRQQECLAGIARNSIRCGNLKRGLSVAKDQLQDSKLIAECADILAGNHPAEAADLYEKSGKFDLAASLYLKVKNTAKLSTLLPHITDVETLTEYGRIKEINERQYRTAADIYARAGQWPDVVRIQLDHLNNPGEAVRIVREQHSVEGAKLVAKFFQRLNDMPAAIEFLIMSRCYDDAYNLALTSGQMDVYADILEHHYRQGHDDDERIRQDFRTIAIYYEQQQQKQQDHFRAGKFYCLSGNRKKGIKWLLAAAKEAARIADNQKENEALTLAIDVAAVDDVQDGHQDQKSKNDPEITRLIVDYLMGDDGGEPRDFKYLFRLYMKMQFYGEAAKTAAIIAREEQNSGNYRNARQLLFSMCTALAAKKNSGQHGNISAEMAFNLMLVHSYMLAKIWIRIGDHKISSKLLIRVYDNINQFPAHSVQILTFVVIECLRAGYYKNALQFAYTLMKPETRDKIEPKLKKKIETLVRKHPRQQSLSNDELQQELYSNTGSRPCPYCQESVREDQLTCPGCRSMIPFCIASGMHIGPPGSDLTKCPRCQFPAIKSYFLQLLAFKPQLNQCPMCEQELNVNDPNEFEPVEHVDDFLNVNSAAAG